MLKIIAPERDFKRSIVLLSAFGFVHAIVLLCGILLPLGILYGPLIYLAYKSAKGESLLFSYLHIIPFLFLLFVYVLTLFGIEFSVSWAYGLTRFKHIEYLALIPFSLFIYSTTIFVTLKRGDIHSKQKKVIMQLSIIAVFYGLGLVLFSLQKATVLSLGISIQSLLFLFPLAIVIFTALFFLNSKKQIFYPVLDLPGKDILYADRTAIEMVQMLDQTLKEHGLYRNSSISLEMLSDKINIPRHHLSHFLNTYLGKSFYQLIAEYRIDYAKKRLKEDNLITIETLAYECGFNSKTSLNKYFKEVTGFAPSQYRLDANQLP